MIVKTLRLLALGVWLGAAVFFGAVVAPNLFAVLRGAQLANANEIAGTIVTRLLATINIVGFVIALFLIATALVMKSAPNRFAQIAEMISLAIMAIMTGVSHWIISARMLALRAAMGSPIDQIAHDDPRRVAFDSLHHYSVVLMGVATIVGLVAFVIMTARPSDSSPTVRNSVL